ncbi:MAG: biopolymer transporter ExbB, partial [Rhodobacteraceae bacterium]|nr:biopolymer transporter ExbB [Paracoccaceae bacterium]
MARNRTRAETQAEQVPTFSQPIRQIVIMLFVVVLVGAGAWFIHGTVAGIFSTNPVLNGFIASVFLVGVLTCFWQVLTLIKSVSWIEDFVRHLPGHDRTQPPQLLLPLAAQMRSRAAMMQISTAAQRSILESVATRIDEARDITRYLTNLLIFLGLLGTFYGLATTVPAVVDTIRSLAPKDGESGMQVFSRLMTGLESQLGGMGTAFSASLLGLAGSLVIGLLELFSNHGQNRFYRELEDWLSSITRVSLSDGEGADHATMAAMLDQMAGQMDALQSLYTQSDVTRV